MISRAELTGEWFCIVNHERNGVPVAMHVVSITTHVSLRARHCDATLKTTPLCPVNKADNELLRTCDMGREGVPKVKKTQNICGKHFAPAHDPFSKPAPKLKHSTLHKPYVKVQGT